MRFPFDEGGCALPDDAREALEFQASHSPDGIRAFRSDQMESPHSLPEQLRPEWDAIRGGSTKDKPGTRAKINSPLLPELFDGNEIRGSISW